MVAFLGFAAQYGATGKGPIDNLADHIASGGHINFITNVRPGAGRGPWSFWLNMHAPWH